MLKVVGASWEQTRLTKFLLSIVIIIAIFAIFFYEATPTKDDGSYTAVALWTQNGGVRIEFLGQNNDPIQIKLHAARAYYQPHYKKTGWTSLEIETSPQYSDSVQARAAGMLEGSLCWQLIFWHWQNTVGYMCEQREELCTKIKRILMDNYTTNKGLTIALGRNDAYWHQVHLFYTQIEGLLEGWELGVKRSRRQIPTELTLADFLWMNHRDDVRDLELMLVNSSYFYNPTHPPTDLAVIKYSPLSKSTFLIGHQSVGLYSEMLRMTKRYSLSYRRTAFTSSGEIPGYVSTFTSYPAAIHSQDDFYQIKGRTGLIVLSSRLVNHNNKLWSNSDSKVVLMGVRATVANRLASTGEQWVRLMSRYNSGTGNKLWLVLDTTHYKYRLWALEQYPGKTNYSEISNSWRKKGFCIRSGIPQSKATMELLGYTNTDSGKNMVSFVEPITALLEKRLPKTENMQDLRVLLSNEEIVKRSRGDLMVHPLRADKFKDTNATETGIFRKAPLPSKILPVGTSPSLSPYMPVIEQIDNQSVFKGLIDTKLANDLHSFQAVAGPLNTIDQTEQGIQPFQWSTTDNTNWHIGQPDLWDFPPMTSQWFWWKLPNTITAR